MADEALRGRNPAGELGAPHFEFGSARAIFVTCRSSFPRGRGDILLRLSEAYYYSCRRLSTLTRAV
jgi:hypothetical protein